LGDKIKEDEMGWTCSLRGRDETLKGGEPLGRPRRGWKDNIKMNLKEIGLEDVE
jgi:hypothetical protein